MTASTAPARLTVDHLTAPTGVAVEHPVLGWQPAAADTRTPTHVEIEVRRLAPTGQPLEPPVWASGRRPYTTPWVTYDGEPLASDADYTWRVRSWCERPDSEPPPGQSRHPGPRPASPPPCCDRTRTCAPPGSSPHRRPLPRSLPSTSPPSSERTARLRTGSPAGHACTPSSSSARSSSCPPRPTQQPASRAPGSSPAPRGSSTSPSTAQRSATVSWPRDGPPTPSTPSSTSTTPPPP